MQDVMAQALEVMRNPQDKNHHPAVMRLALTLGVSFYTIEHWRTGRRSIGAATRERLEAIARREHA
jgi:hypothetical protein